MPKLAFTLLTLLLVSLPACKILQVAPEGGSIESASGLNDCPQSRECEIEVERGAGFSDTFTAVPAPGFRFRGWKKADKHLCGGSLQPCALENVPTDLTDQDIDLWLEPVFVSEQVIRGEAVYRTPQPSGNNTACVHCHALSEPSNNGFRRPGHQIGDAAGRPDYKNGQLTRLLDAVNTCLDEWMIADTWTDASEDWLALQAFLASEAGDHPAESLEIEIASPPANLEGGDGQDGRTLFNTSCAICHDIDGEGSNIAPRIAGIGLDPGYIARRVRTSGSTGSAVYDQLTGGVMPFWARDRLADDELRDLVAYLTEGDNSDVIDGGDEGGDGDRDCAMDHPKVGQTAQLIGRFHDVSGTATIVDNCTIVVSDFHYDGEGIVVEFYAGNNGDYDPPAGFSISDNIKGRRYRGARIVINLDEGIDLNSFNGISVWCVDVGVSFGDALFQ